MITRKTKIALPAALVLVLVMAFSACSNDAPRITQDELKAELGKPNVQVLDVRAAQDWESTQWKIQGAVREDPSKVEQWMDKYPKDKKIVLYCA